MMNDNKPKITADVQRLIDMEDEMILARDIAPIIHVKPDVIIKYAKTGQWDQENLGKFVISGDHVKFFRMDFLQKCGFVEPEKKESRTDQLLDEICTKMDLLLSAITALMNQDQRREFVEAWQDDNEKPPAAATADGDPGIREKGIIL